VTISIACVPTLSGGVQELCLASDSRLRDGRTIDASPKVFALPRNDAAICFAGETAIAYPYMLHVHSASLSHRPARTRGLDITKYRTHVFKILNNLVDGIDTPIEDLRIPGCQFLLGGYSWLDKCFHIWRVGYFPSQGMFHYDTAKGFCGEQESFMLAGDAAVAYRAVFDQLVTERRCHHWGEQGLDLEPFEALVGFLRSSGPDASVGGPPQLVKVYQHTSTLPIPVLWPDRKSDHVSMLGRQLVEYENVDEWALDPDSMERVSPDSVRALQQAAGQALTILNEDYAEI
jgi:hypothetical protein